MSSRGSPSTPQLPRQPLPPSTPSPLGKHVCKNLKRSQKQACCDDYDAPVLKGAFPLLAVRTNRTTTHQKAAHIATDTRTTPGAASPSSLLLPASSSSCAVKHHSRRSNKILSSVAVQPSHSRKASSSLKRSPLLPVSSHPLTAEPVSPASRAINIPKSAQIKVTGTRKLSTMGNVQSDAVTTRASSASDDDNGDGSNSGCNAVSPRRRRKPLEEIPLSLANSRAARIRACADTRRTMYIDTQRTTDEEEDSMETNRERNTTTIVPPISMTQRSTLSESFPSFHNAASSSCTVERHPSSTDQPPADEPRSSYINSDTKPSAMGLLRSSLPSRAPTILIPSTPSTPLTPPLESDHAIPLFNAQSPLSASSELPSPSSTPILAAKYACSMETSSVFGPCDLKSTSYQHNILQSLEHASVGTLSGHQSQGNPDISSDENCSPMLNEAAATAATPCSRPLSEPLCTSIPQDDSKISSRRSLSLAQ